MATRALAALAGRLAGAPLVHDLAAAAPALLAAALADDLPAAPADANPDPEPGPSAPRAVNGSTASSGGAGGACAGAPGGHGKERAGRPRQRANGLLLPEQAAAESRRLHVRADFTRVCEMMLVEL